MVTLIRLFFERRGQFNAYLMGIHQDYLFCRHWKKEYIREMLFISRKAKKKGDF